MAKWHVYSIRTGGREPDKVYHDIEYADTLDAAIAQFNKIMGNTYVAVAAEPHDDYASAAASKFGGFALYESRYRHLRPGVWPPVPWCASTPTPPPAAVATPGPRKPPPVLPPEVHHTATFDAEAAMAAVRALSKGT